MSASLFSALSMILFFCHSSSIEPVFLNRFIPFQPLAVVSKRCRGSSLFDGHHIFLESKSHFIYVVYIANISLIVLQQQFISLLPPSFGHFCLSAGSIIPSVSGFHKSNMSNCVTLNKVTLEVKQRLFWDTLFLPFPINVHLNDLSIVKSPDSNTFSYLFKVF